MFRNEIFKDIKLRQAMPPGGRGRRAWIATAKQFCPRDGWVHWTSKWCGDFASLSEHMWERMGRPGVKIIPRKQRID